MTVLNMYMLSTLGLLQLDSETLSWGPFEVISLV